MPYSPQDVHKKLLGKKGEKIALKYLQDKGYALLETNYRTPFGEADIIAQKDDEIIFVEVKTRSGDSYGAPKEAVGKDKKRRYYQMASYYGKQTGEAPNARFDVIEVYADGKIEHYEYAF